MSAKHLLVALVWCLCLCHGPARSAQGTQHCFEHAGKLFGVDPLLLYAIAQVESHQRVDSVGLNPNGTRDYGLMQVNERHLDVAQRARALSDACFAIQKGTEILSGMMHRFGRTWEAVGAYNAGGAKSREGMRRRYAAKVSACYRILVQRRRARYFSASGNGASQRPFID